MLSGGILCGQAEDNKSVREEAELTGIAIVGDECREDRIIPGVSIICEKEDKY